MMKKKCWMLILLLVLLCSCGKESDQWTMEETNRGFQAVSLASNVSSIALNNDALYMLQSDGYRDAISQYKGAELLQDVSVDTVFFVDETVVVTAEPTDTDQMTIHRYDLSGGTQTDVEVSIPVDSDGYLQCNDIVLLDDTVIFTWTATDRNYAGGTYGVVALDFTSQSVGFSQTLSSQSSGIFTTGEQIYIAAGEQLYVLTGDTLEEKSSFPFRIYSTAALSDGTVLLSSDTALFGWTPGTMELTRLVDWGSLLLDSAPTKIAATSMDMIYCLSDTEVFCITEAKQDENANVLTLATDSPQSVSDLVREFNSSHTDYQIQVAAYTSEDSSLLNIQLATGDVPDIYCFGSNFYGESPFEPDIYAAKGLLADLYDYIDKDGELSRDSFLPNILGSLETEGGNLYTLPSGFWIDVIVGDAQIVGDTQGWTFQEMNQRLEELGYEGTVFGPHMTQSLLLQFLLAYNQNEFINWDRGTCNFDSADFAELLEFVAQSPQTQDSSENRTEYELISQRQQLLMYGKLGNVKAIQEYIQLFETKDLCFIGFPTASGIGNSFSYDVSFAISTTCKAPDVAWEFIRNFFTDDYNAPAFPINKVALERKMQTEQETEGETIISYSSGYETKLTAPSQEECDTVIELICSLDRGYSYDRNIYQIVSEEAQAYFDGEKSLSAVTEVIQQRCAIYLSEQS